MISTLWSVARSLQVETEPPHVATPTPSTQKQCREPKRAAVPVDQICQDGDDHATTTANADTSTGRRPDATRVGSDHSPVFTFTDTGLRPEVCYWPLATSYAEQMPGVAVVTDSRPPWTQLTLPRRHLDHPAGRDRRPQPPGRSPAAGG